MPAEARRSGGANEATMRPSEVADSMVTAASNVGAPPFAIEQRGTRNWVSLYKEVACRHAHPSAMSAIRCGRHRRRDSDSDDAVEDSPNGREIELAARHSKVRRAGYSQ